MSGRPDPTGFAGRKPLLNLCFHRFGGTCPRGLIREVYRDLSNVSTLAFNEATE